ncbi:MAG: SDR family oxidoreductase [Microbacteriaceae bacterium]
MVDKRVVVTGASSGIGAATARLFAERGWSVIAVARRADRLAALAEESEALAGSIEGVRADLTDADDVAALRDRLAASGPVHALVNNAGGAFGMATVEDGDVDDWRRMFEINVIGTKQMISALLPLLRDGARESGHADILSITSVAASEVYEGGGGYHAAKFAQAALMRTLRLELAGEPLRVLELAPGMVKTDEFSTTRFGGDEEKAAKVYAGVDDPLSAEDVAATIVHTIELPGHINLDHVTIRPVAQAAAHKTIRQPLEVKA